MQVSFSSRRIFPVLVLLLLSGARAERKPVALGLLGGMNVASLWGQDVHDIDVRFWPVAGISLAFHLPQFLGVETDVMYASRGSVFKQRISTDSNRINTFKSQTITVPLLLKLTAPIGTEVQPFFFGGPAIAYAFSKGNSSEILGPDSTGQIRFMSQPQMIADKDMSVYDLLLTVGGGLEWGLGTVQVRLNLGQNSLDRSKKVDIKTFTVDAMAGFIF